MEQTRLILLIAFSFISLMMWEAWQRDYAPLDAAPLTTIPKAPAAQPDSTPNILQNGSTQLTPNESSAAKSTNPTASFVTVETDVLQLKINLTGGVIEQAGLIRYPPNDGADSSTFHLLDNTAERFFVYQSGLKAVTGESADHYANFTSDQASFKLSSNDNSLRVVLRWKSASGVSVLKEYLLERGSYKIRVVFSIDNQSSQAWSFNHYDQLQRTQQERRQYFIQTFTGAAFSSPAKRYAKHSYKDLTKEPVNENIVDGWAAILEHYFVAAIIPPPQESYHYYSTIIGASNYAVGFYGPAKTLDAGAQTSVESSIFIGPKLQNLLAKVAPGLELTVDYGILWFIGKVLFWTLAKMHALTGNWGWAIIFLTCIVKFLFFPLSAAGYRSMAKMRVVQPRLLAIRERYQSDRSALNQAMMDLYKKEKINPLGGCLPIVVQIPIFMALYWVILESVELRQAPWILWIQDLSIKDPWFVLPVLMTISMWLQSKLNPAPVDPIQAKVMQIMPFAFGVFFAFFPAGLVLYWFVNNCLSIAQQWFITRAAERAA